MTRDLSVTIIRERTINGIRFTPIEFDHSFLNCKKELEVYGYQVGKTILKNGGRLENEVTNDVGLGESGVIQR